MTEVSRLTNSDGFDVTEGVQVIFDALIQSMDAGSGMLDYREWCALRQVAWALGLDLDATGTGTEWNTGMYGSGQEFAWPDPSAPLTDEPRDDAALTIPVVHYYAQIETQRDPMRRPLTETYRKLIVTAVDGVFGNHERMAIHEVLTRETFRVQHGLTAEQVELLPIKWGSETKYVRIKDAT